MTFEEVLALSGGATIGFCWLPLQIAPRIWPEGFIARSLWKNHSISEKTIAFFVALFAVWAMSLVEGFEPQIGEPEIDRASRLLLDPILIGPVIWFLVVLVFGEAPRSKRLSNTTDKRQPETLEFQASEALIESGIPVDEAIAQVPKSRETFAIDGNNIALIDGNTPTVSIIRSLASFLLNRGDEVVVFFDANIGWLLTKGKSDLSNSELAELIGIPEEIVSKVPGGTQADEWILSFARDDNAIVISNDQFRDYVNEHSFIGDEGRLRKVMKIGNRVQVQGFDEPVLLTI